MTAAVYAGTLTGRRILVAALGLLAFAPQASAEGTWVLWQSDPGPTPDWRSMSSYQSLADCQVAMEGNKLAAQEIGAKMNVTCLPDTADPRGPKGT